MKLSELCNVYQYHQITDEEIYYSVGNIPIYTGDNELKGYWNKVFAEDITLPCLSYPVKGFKGGITVQKEKFDANNTAVLCLKEEYKEAVELEWLKYILPHYFMKKLINKEGISYLSKEVVQDINIELIDKEKQIEQLVTYKKLEKMYSMLCIQKSQIEMYMKKQIILSDNIQRTEILKNVLKYVSRNDCLSEFGLYQRSANTEDKITVLSGASDGTVFGMIDSSQKGVHWLNNRQALHLVTRGKAGTLTFLEKGKYATNTNAFLLYIPYENWGKMNISDEREEKIYLKYLKCYLQHIFLGVSSGSDLAVFPLTETMNEMRIPLFQYNREMERVVECIERLERAYEIVKTRLGEVEKLRSYKIV